MRFRKAGTVYRLFAYSARERRMFITGILISMVAVVTSTLAPRYLSEIVDEIGAMVGEGSVHTTDHILWSMAAVLALCAATLVLVSLKNWFIEHASVRLADTLRKDLFDKTGRIPYSYFVHARTGDVTSRITSDCKTIAYYSGPCIQSIVSSIATQFGAGVMMVIINPELAAVCIFPIESGMLLVVFFSKSIKRFFVARQKMLGMANSTIMDCIYGHTTIRMFDAEDQVLRDFGSVNGELSDNLDKSQRYSAVLPSLMGLVNNISYVVLCGYGAVMVVRGDVTVGVIVGFLVYMKIFSDPIVEFANSLSTFNQVTAAADRVFGMLDAEEMQTAGVSAPSDVKGDIRFDDVRFAYGEGGRNIIDGVSLDVKQGQTVAVVGLSGSGKTTLMNLLMGFYEIGSGDIRIDGRSLREMDHFTVHGMFSLVNQDNWIFKGTYRENLVYSSRPRTDEEVFRMCDSVGMTFVRGLPDGLDTEIANPQALSAGQKQQMAIVRAMMRDAPILILDEATSQVDVNTEKSIVRAIEMLSETKTSFVIAHRLSTVRNADLIVVLENGRITEQGTWDDLMQRKGCYYRLVRTQSAGVADPARNAAAHPCAGSVLKTGGGQGGPCQM